MNAQIIKNRIRKIAAYSLAAIIFLLLSSFLLLQVPPVQQQLVNRYLGDLTQITGFPTTVKSFRMLWFDRLELENVMIHDPEKNEMIGVDRLRINFKLFQLVSKGFVHIDGISVKGAHVELKNIAEKDTVQNLNINVFINRINEHFSSEKSGGKPPVINIGEAVVENSEFIYNDKAPDSPEGFDYHHFAIDIDEAALDRFVVLGDTIEFNVRSLFASDRKTQLSIRQFTSFFRISQKALEFYDLHVKAGNSYFSDTLIFRYESQQDLRFFNDAVTIKASLKNCVIHPSDIALFAPAVRKITSPIFMAGDFDGRVNKFRLKRMKMKMGNTEFQGKLSMEGLPYLDETFIELSLNNSRIDFRDLSFATNDYIIDRLKPLGSTRLSGEFVGYIYDFVANGTFQSTLGHIESDINLKINQENTEKSVYSGNLRLTDFDLGKYLNDTINFQQINLTGEIKGYGLGASTADFKLKSTIQSMGVRQYNYSNIKTDARFARGFFDGTFKINDPNLRANATGSIDLRKQKNLLQLKGRVDTANVHQLHLIRDELYFSTSVNINSHGLTLDSLVGIGQLNDLSIKYNDQEAFVKEIRLQSDKESSLQNLSLQSDLLNANIKGNFYFSDLFNDINSLITELQLNIANDEARIANYYQSNKKNYKDYAANFEVLIKDIEPVAEIFDLDLSLSQNVKVEGSFTNGVTTMLTAYTEIPKVQYQGFTFEKSTVEMNTSKLADSTSVLAMAFIRSDKQVIESVATENLLAEAIWNRNHIDFSLDANQQKMKNNVRLRGTVDFIDSTYIHLKNSTFQLLEKEWRINDNTRISQKGSEWQLQDMGFAQGDQRLSIFGHVSKDETLPLTITLENINLESFNSLTTESFKGLVQAEVTLRNLYKNLTIENIMDVNDFTVNNFLVGDIFGKNQWNAIEKKFLIDFQVNRHGLEAITLTGHYDPLNTVSPLNVMAKLNQANLKLAEPVLRGLFSQIDGTLTGEFALRGTINKPMIRGAGQVANGQFMVDYLKTLYQFNGTIGMTPSSIYFENILLTDAFNNKARLEGFIAHRNFNNMRLNIDSNFKNFMVLNTTAKDNSLFYGQGFATGQVNFFGPVANLKISASAKTDKNSKLYIPLNSSGTVEKKEFINFVSLADTTFNKTTEADNRKVLTGMSIDLNLEVTEDTYCEIIFDIKAGDIIRGRGNGDLRLQLDTKGEFNMFGGITFEQGGYNFTLYSLINKEFQIQKGSRITWLGNPYEGQLNINAAYNQLASLSPIITNLDDETRSSPALRRKYPMQVLLKLEGPMLSPQIDFDIVAKELPQTLNVGSQNVRLAFEFEAFKAKLDEQELKKQVFSLIILRRLSPLNETISTSGSVTNSVSELLSNQLSYWVSQMDENLEIDIDLGTLDQDAFNTFQLRLSYSFFNGRLRVTRDGTFGNQSSLSSTTTNSNTAALVGDWTVDYLLTQDGKFKVRMYNRTNVNPIIATLNNQNTITTGVSLQHTQSFNTLSDLWKSARQRKENSKAPIETNKEAVLKEEDGGGND
jgi:hypothetical protein